MKLYKIKSELAFVPSKNGFDVLFECDPSLNTKCKAKHCGECHLTHDIRYAKRYSFLDDEADATITETTTPEDIMKGATAMSTTLNSNIDHHKAICQHLTDVYEKKNHDYGDSFHQSFEEDGLLMAKIRIGDKYSRFKTLCNAGAEVKDESIRDTLLDLANYAIMTVMELDAKSEWR